LRSRILTTQMCCKFNIYALKHVEPPCRNQTGEGKTPDSGAPPPPPRPPPNKSTTSASPFFSATWTWGPPVHLPALIQQASTHPPCHGKRRPLSVVSSRDKGSCALGGAVARPI
jgi:hypothetical protein